MTSPQHDAAADAVQWWQAYLLAETDQAGELRERVAAGDDHARRQLAGWLADRVKTDEAINVIRPLADAGDDVAELWLARWLADGDRIDELRRRAENGSYPALEELADWLAAHEHMAELRQFIGAHEPLLSRWLGRQHDMKLVRLAAELGDEDARQRLERWVRRMHERGVTVVDDAFQVSGDNPDGGC